MSARKHQLQTARERRRVDLDSRGSRSSGPARRGASSTCSRTGSPSFRSGRSRRPSARVRGPCSTISARKTGWSTRSSPTSADGERHSSPDGRRAAASTIRGRCSSPRGNGSPRRAHERLVRTIFEIDAIALRDRRRFGTYLRSGSQAWTDPIAVLLEARGFGTDRARSLAGLVVATARGLVYDVLASADRTRADRAFRSLIAAIELPDVSV